MRPSKHTHLPVSGSLPAADRSAPGPSLSKAAAGGNSGSSFASKTGRPASPEKEEQFRSSSPPAAVSTADRLRARLSLQADTTRTVKTESARPSLSPTILDLVRFGSEKMFEEHAPLMGIPATARDGRECIRFQSGQKLVAFLNGSLAAVMKHELQQLRKYVEEEDLDMEDPLYQQYRQHQQELTTSIDLMEKFYDEKLSGAEMLNLLESIAVEYASTKNGVVTDELLPVIEHWADYEHSMKAPGAFSDPVRNILEAMLEEYAKVGRSAFREALENTVLANKLPMESRSHQLILSALKQVESLHAS